METLAFVRSLPKAELHMHLEGSLEPEMLVELARRNGVEIPFRTVAEVRDAYRFSELQDFLDIYYQGMGVLREEEDFHALALSYMRRAAHDGAVHVEVFYDPQGHTGRGIPFAVATDGILSGLAEGGRQLGMSWRLILCFLRHLDEEDGFATFHEAEPWFADGRIAGIGLDSTERGNPPVKFERLFRVAGEIGLRRVAHAGEEGTAENVRDAVEILKLDRIDHGNAALDDSRLVERLAARRMPLTVCPLSNVKLRVVPEIAAHPLRRMLQAGLCATVNSDDPAYFGGYIGDNFMAVAEALGLSRAELVTLARNSIEASFLDAADKAPHLARLDGIAAAL